MRELEQVSEQLKDLQTQLQGTANRLWKLKFSLNSAYHLGFSERDFLPRRILTRRREEQEQFEALVQRLKSLIDHYLASPFLVLGSDHDLPALFRIQRTIRYLKNAYCSDPPLLHALARISRVLTAAKAG